MTAPLPVVRVVVHPDGAVVHREGFAPVVDGRAEVAGLPYLLDPTSVRVEAAGVGEVEVDLDPASLAPPGAPPLLLRLRAAALAAQRHAARAEALRAARGWIGRIRPEPLPDPGHPRPTADTLAAWSAADDAVDARLAAIDEQLAAAERAHRDAEEERAALASKASAESGEGAARHLLPARRVRARVGAAGTVRIGVSYTVPGAAWSPAYLLQTDAGLARGSFALRALVVQATGEDWRGVALSLSTAPVARRVDVPALRALRLSARQERPPTAFRDLPSDLDALFPDLDLPPAPAVPELLLDEEVAPVEAPSTPRPARAWTQIPALEAVARASAPPPGAVPRSAPAPSPRPAAPPPAALVVDDLDYGRLRIAPPTAAPGRRGRLFPAPDEDRASELGAARDRFRAGVESLRASSAAVSRTTWPPHHTLAAPVQGEDRVFAVEGRVDLPADGHLHSVAVAAWPATLAVSYRAVPRLDPRAFRLVDARLEGAAGALLPGPVDVLVDGRLELTTGWTGSAGRGQLRIGLGAEDRLKVARNVRYQEESAGLFGGSRRITTRIDVVVASALPTPARVELLDRIPVPAERETLAVEITESSPVAEAWKGEPDAPAPKGLRAQRVEVPPGGEARAILAYAVTLGAKDELVGGDRRG